MAPQDKVVEPLAGRSRSSSSSHSNAPQHQEPREQQLDDDHSNHQLSVEAAMSTTTATTGGGVDVDDASSMGGSRRKRKDDCSESRCTVTSEEESARRRSRRRRHRLQSASSSSSCHRWLERIDRTAATSHAPIRPSRSDDEAFVPAGWMAATTTTGMAADNMFSFPHQQRTFSSSLPRIEGATGKSTILHATGATSRGGRSYSDADVTAREVARCYSLSLPPVRPTREVSKTDLMNPSDSDSDEEDRKCKASGSKKNAAFDRKNNNEIDPHMYARLLHGATGISMDQPSHTLSFHRSGGGGTTISSTDYAARTAPPKKPRRRSDPDTLPAFLFNALEKHRVPQPPSLTRFNTLAGPVQRPPDLTFALDRTTSGTTGNYVCPQDCQTMRVEKCQHAVSPMPPAKPSRTEDDRCCNAKKPAFTDLEAPSLHSVHRVSEPTTCLEKDATASRRETGSGLQEEDHHKNEMSASSAMDLEEAEDDVKPRANQGSNATPHNVEKEDAVKGDEELIEHEDDGDETEVSGHLSVKEYDPDLFARLLSGEACDTQDADSRPTGQLTTTGLSARKNNEAPQPLPSLVARVSSGTTTATPHPGYNRFDNSAPCAVPEHMAGAVKSSHPPMRPRRSIDECLKSDDKFSDSLAASVAAAFVAEAVENGDFTPDPEIMPPPIRLVGSKRRASRRPSRRLTLPLASEMPSSNDNTTNAQNPRTEVEPLDSTREANLMAFSKSHDESYGDSSETFDERDDIPYEESEVSCTAADGSYSRILPARRRRRVMRRFTMPSKGRSLSPLTKKRRKVERSVSLRSSNEEMMTPAA